MGNYTVTVATDMLLHYDTSISGSAFMRARMRVGFNFAIDPVQYAYCVIEDTINFERIVAQVPGSTQTSNETVQDNWYTANCKYISSSDKMEANIGGVTAGMSGPLNLGPLWSLDIRLEGELVTGNFDTSENGDPLDVYQYFDTFSIDRDIGPDIMYSDNFTSGPIDSGWTETLSDTSSCTPSSISADIANSQLEFTGYSKCDDASYQQNVILDRSDIPRYRSLTSRYNPYTDLVARIWVNDDWDVQHALGKRGSSPAWSFVTGASSTEAATLYILPSGRIRVYSGYDDTEKETSDEGSTWSSV